MTKSEVLAYLNTLERSLQRLTQEVAEFRLVIIEGLDSDGSDLLD